VTILFLMLLTTIASILEMEVDLDIFGE